MVPTWRIEYEVDKVDLQADDSNAQGTRGKGILKTKTCDAKN